MSWTPYTREINGRAHIFYRYDSVPSMDATAVARLEAIGVQVTERLGIPKPKPSKQDECIALMATHHVGWEEAVKMWNKGKRA